MSNTVIALKSSGTASNVVNANNLVYGELAINYADGILYYKTASNTVGSIKTAQPGGLNTEIQFNDSGVFGGSSNFVYQKSNVRLGIGTSSPLGKLHIKSNAAAGAGGFSHLVVDQTLDSSQSRISLKSRFGSLSVTETEVAAIHLGTVTAGYVSGILSSDIRFDTINTGTLSERVRIKSDGNVGIGTTNPSYPLEIASPNSTSIAFQRTGVSAKKWGFDSDNDSLYIVNITDFSQRLTVTNDGKIGIGTIYPSTQLYVKTEGTSNTSVKTALTLENYPYAFDPASNGFGVGIEFRGKNPQGGSSIYGNIEGVYETRSGTHQGGALLFKTDGYIGDSTTRMIIDSVGNLGLGTTSPAAFTGFTTNRTVLQIKNSTSDSGQLILGGINALLVDYDNSTGNATIRNTYGSTSANALINIDSGTLVFRTGTSYTESVRITSAGNVGIGTTSVPSGYKLGITGSGINFLTGNTTVDGSYKTGSQVVQTSLQVTSGKDVVIDGVTSGRIKITIAWSNSSGTAVAVAVIEGTTRINNSATGYVLTTYSLTDFYFENGYYYNVTDNPAIAITSPYNGNSGDKITLTLKGSDGYAGLTATVMVEAIGSYLTPISLSTPGTTTSTSWISDIRTFRTGNTERMRITSDGNVGIGKTDPGFKLDVDTSARISATNGSGSLQIGTATPSVYHYINFGGAVGGTDDAWQIGRSPTGGVGPANGFYVYDLKSSATRFVINTSGNVGIGTTSPGSKLDVKGTLRLSGSNTGYVGITTAADAGSTTYILPSTDGTNGHVLSTNGSGTLSWVSAAGASSYWVQTGNDIYYTTGNVGIGTSSPSNSKLHIVGDWVGGHSTVKVQGITDATTGYGFYNTDGSRLGYLAYTSAGFEWYNNINVPIIFHTNTAERMRITGAGNVGVGTSSPTDKLTVSGGSNGGVRVNGSDNVYLKISGAAVNEKHIDFYHDNTLAFENFLDGSNNFIWRTRVGGLTERMRITSDGNVGIGTTSPGSKLSVTGTNSGSVPLVDLVASGTGTFQRGVRLLNSGMNNGDQIMYGVGTADSAYNMGQFYFYKAGTGSTSNRISMGLHSVDDVFNILGTGNVGIGTTSPGAILHVNASGGGTIRASRSSVSDEYIQMDHDGTNGSLRVSGAYSLIFHTNSIERARITSDGNVGIGTASPFGTTSNRTCFSVNGTNDVSLNVGSGGVQRAYLYGSASVGQVGTIGGLPLVFAPNDTERVRITSDGNVGVGTSSPAAKLTVVNTSAGNVVTAMRLSNDSSTTGSGSRIEFHTADAVFNAIDGVRPNSGSGGELRFLTMSTGGTLTERARIDSSGNFIVSPIGGSNNGQTFKLGVYRASSDVQLLINSDNGYNTYINFAGFSGGLSYGRDGGTGYFRWNNAVDFGGSQIMTLTDGGNLGVGTTSPGCRLDVTAARATSRLTSSTGTNAVDFQANNTGGQLLLGIDNSAGSSLFGAGGYTAGLWYSGAYPLAFGTNNTERARITSGGDLLVGPTSVPSPVANYRSLVVGGSTGGIVDIGTTSTSYGRVSADSVGLNVESLGATTTIFRTNNTERARITSAGNVGIGTTSPGQKLSIVEAANYDPPATTGTNGGHFAVLKNDGPAAGSYGFLMGVSNNGNVWQQVQRVDGTQSVYNLLLQPSGGNVGIGTTSPSEKLQVNGNIKIPTGGILYVENPAGGRLGYLTTNSTGTLLSAHNDSGEPLLLSAPASTAYMSFSTAGSERARITSNGNLGIGTTTPQYRLDVNSGLNSNSFSASFGSTHGIGVWSGIHFGYLETGNSAYRKSALIFERQDNAARGKIHILNNGADSGASATLADARLTILYDGKIGIGTTSPGKKLTISRASETTSEQLEFRVEGGISTGNYDGIVWTQGASGDTTLASIRVAYNSSGSPDMVFNLRNDNNVIFLKNGGNVGIGTNNPGYKLEVNGSFAATTKSFVIDHPTKEGMKLRYGSLEGPENGVYIRGRLKNNNTIELPEYWTKLVDPDTITVQLTPIGKNQELYVEDILNNKVIIAGSENINCFYMILAERIDVEKLTVEYKEEN